MELIELFLVALSLSMDAFAVSLCKGLSVGRPTPGQCLTCGAWFGGFQALMPLIDLTAGRPLSFLCNRPPLSPPPPGRGQKIQHEKSFRFL